MSLVVLPSAFPLLVHGSTFGLLYYFFKTLNYFKQEMDFVYKTYIKKSHTSLYIFHFTQIVRWNAYQMFITFNSNQSCAINKERKITNILKSVDKNHDTSLSGVNFKTICLFQICLSFQLKFASLRKRAPKAQCHPHRIGCSFLSCLTCKPLGSWKFI